MIIFALLLCFSIAADIESGVVLNPESSNAFFTTENNLSIDNFKVYDNKVKLNQTNVTVQNDQVVEAKVWNSTYMKTTSGKLEYSFNDSVQLNIDNLNPILYYRIRFNESFQREVNSQSSISISAPANTNITVEAYSSSSNNAPTYSNVKPANDANGLKRPVNLSFKVSDADAENLDITLYNVSDDSVIASKNNIESGSTIFTLWSGLNTNTTYSWYADITDGRSNTTVSPRSFRTNSPPELNPDQQYYDNFSINHEFEVEAFAKDYDGETDIQKCEVYYSDNQGNSGTIQGTIYDTSYGTSKDVKCNKNLSNQLKEIDVGESVTTEVRFYDGGDWVNTSQDSNPVPNNPPTPPTDMTNISENIIYHNPSVSWIGEDDPDGDNITVKAYTGNSSTPTSLDNSADADVSSMNLGKNVNLTDGNTYYYRLRVCDQFGKCGAYTASDRFSLNQEPRIISHNLNNTDPKQGNSVLIEANVNDSNLDYMNFTVWEGSNKILDNQKGTTNAGNWTSPELLLDKQTSYNYSIIAVDKSNEVTEVNRSFNLGYRQSGIYTKNYETGQIAEIKTVYYGELNSGNIKIKANTSSSDKKQLENNTWKDLRGENITLEFQLTTSNASETPGLKGYDLYYRTDPQTPGYVSTTIKDFGNEVKVEEFIVQEVQPSGTNVTYELRSGPDSSVNQNWTDWKICLESCKPDLPKNRYFQYRVNLSSQNNKVPEVTDIEVKYG